MVIGALSLHCSHGETPRYGFLPGGDGAGNEPNGVDSPGWFVPDLELEPPAAESARVRFLDWDPLPSVQPQSSSDLAEYFPAQAQLVGVALDERDESALPYLLEAHSGLYQLTGSGVQQVFDLRASRVIGGSGGSVPAELTDVAFDRMRSEQLGSASFALTAENDGFALDLPEPVLESYFCYFPGTFEPVPGPAPSVSQELRQQGIPVTERTEAVALNPITQEIVAQPRTLRLDSGEVAGAELFVFDSSGGSPIGTWRLERAEFAAGGAAFQLGQYLVFGFGSDLYYTGNWGSDVVHQLHLEGVGKITGLAARADGDLLVLDGANRRLLEVGVDQIARALGN